MVRQFCVSSSALGRDAIVFDSRVSRLVIDFFIPTQKITKRAGSVFVDSLLSISGIIVYCSG